MKEHTAPADFDGYLQRMGSLMKKPLSSSRMSSIGYFSKIVKENHRKWIRLQGRLKEAKRMGKKTGENTEFDRQAAFYEDELAKTSFILTVFTAVAIEAYIYDYAARHLGDRYVKEHLDKLDTISKWIIIPELVTGRGLSQRQHWQAKLKNIIQARNSITHFKSWDPSSLSAADVQEKVERSSNQVRQAAAQAIDLLRLLADKISEVDPEETPWVQSYLV